MIAGLRPTLALALTLPGMAGAAECRLALALAVDVSRSIDARDFDVQQQGIVAALTDPDVAAALLRPGRPVALAVYYWSGPDDQVIGTDWTVISDGATLAAVAAAIGRYRREGTGGHTALGAALSFGRALMDKAPPCARNVIDVSGDGQNNSGVGPSAVYGREDFRDIVVNALSIEAHERGLTTYFQDRIIRGPGAFVEVAHTQADFPDAIRRKLIREFTESVAEAGPPSRPRG